MMSRMHFLLEAHSIRVALLGLLVELSRAVLEFLAGSDRLPLGSFVLGEVLEVALQLVHTGKR
jgi:membrane protein DedA with SNARE-associated domain